MNLDSNEWYLLKSEDNSVFGPVPLKQLKKWAQEAQISPLDKISTDRQSWERAPMLAQLEMDWLVEVTANELYGPTTVGSVVEFLVHGEINEETTVIYSVDGSKHRLGDIAEREIEPSTGEESDDDTGMTIETLEEDEDEEEETEPAPRRTGIKVSLQNRILDLETALLEERRAFATMEAKYKKLVKIYQNDVGRPYADS